MWQLSYPREEWPRYLWRVIHPETKTVAHPQAPPERKLIADAAIETLQPFHMIPSSDMDFGSCDLISALVDTAAERDPITSDLVAFLDMVANHINWYNESRTWFLSTFSDGDHAMRWAQKRVENGDANVNSNWARRHLKKGDVTVYKIDTTKLPPGTRLFDMETLDELLQLGYRYCKHEILVFGRIPEQAVVDVFELGKDWRDSYSFFSGNVPGHNPGSVWDEDLDGRQLNIRAKVLAAEDSYPEEWAALGDGHWGRRFEVPGTIALCCGYSEQFGEGQSEEEEEEVEVEVVEEVEEQEVEDEDEMEEVEEEEVEEEVEVVEEEVEEEEVVVVVVAEQEEEKEKEEEDKDGEAVVERVKEEVKGKDGDQDGEPERKEEEDENEREGEDETAQLIGRLAIST